MSGTELEGRYRRLLAYYPWSHRRVYEDEMLAVLVAGASPGQRRPTAGETVNLIASGLLARMKAAITGVTNPAWADTAAVFGLLTAIVLLSKASVEWPKPLLYGHSLDSEYLYLRVIGWGAVVLTTVVGLRRSAAVLAWATTLYEVVRVGRLYDDYPRFGAQLFWTLGLCVVTAAALSVPVPRRHAITVLGRRRLLAFVLGVGAVQAIVLVNMYCLFKIWDDPRNNGSVTVTWYESFGLVNRSQAILYLWVAIAAVGALAAVIAVLTLPAAIRWRISVLLAPTAALYVAVALGLHGWSYSNENAENPIYLVPIQWILLVATPLAVLGLGVAFIHKREQLARLAALGQAVDREQLHS